MGFREHRERDRNNGYNRMTSHEGIFERKKNKGFNNVGDNFPREERNTMQGRQETIIGNGTGKIKYEYAAGIVTGKQIGRAHV